MKKYSWMLISSILLIGLCAYTFAADEEILGQQTEQAGKLREAFKHYVAALQSATEGSETDQRLREKIIKLVQKLPKPPALPEEAIKYEGRAEAAFKAAKTPSDFLDAAGEYKKALRLAPWMASYYFNLAIVLETAKRPAEAIQNLKFYLLAAPNAKDATAVKKKIAGLEYEMEKAQRAAREIEEAKAREKRHHDEEKLAKLQALESWSGVWKGISGSMRWMVRISGNTINITYYDHYNYKTEVWSSNHPCPWGWSGTILDNLDLSLIASRPDWCGYTPRPPTMSWPVTGRISFDEKRIYINARDWDFNKGQWYEGSEILSPD